MNLVVPTSSHAAASPIAEAWRLERPLGAVLRKAASDYPHHGLISVDETGHESTLQYAELLPLAERIASALLEKGLAPQDKVIFQTARPTNTISLMWGCLLAGLIAVPTAPVTLLDETAGPLRRFRAIWDMLGRPVVVTERKSAEALTEFGSAHGWEGLHVIAIEDLSESRSTAALPDVTCEMIAMLPLTSGSTGLPKAVTLSHRNILAMAAGTNQANGFHCDDVALNWMPLDHPGALVFLGVVPMDVGASQIHVPTHYVLGDPLRWLELISRHRASISWAPNFAFALLNALLSGTQKRYDLSCMRFMVSAGEQVAASTVRTFLQLMESHGLISGALRPAFGMAETCSGITWSPGLTADRLLDNSPYISLGPPIPGAEIRITDENDNVLVEGEVGILQLRGPSVLSGYYENPGVNASVMRGDGWFRTGDLGFLRRGELHITGRGAELIIVNGLTIAAHDLEAAVEELDGVAVSYAAVFAVWSDAKATEDVIVVFSPEDADPGDAAACAGIAGRIRAHLARQTGIVPARIVPLVAEDIPKTSIGKIQRSALRSRYQAGDFDEIVVAIDRSTAGVAPPAWKRSVPAESPAGNSASIPALEADISAIWSRVLGLETIEPDASFFELGGHSVLLVQVHSLLKESFPALDLVDLFQYPTIRTLAGFLSGPTPTAPAAPAQIGIPAAADGSRDIAVIGMSCRFPGADSVSEFWQNLRAGRESISRFSVEDMVAAGFDREMVSHPDYVRASPALRDPKGFDAGFFGYASREAELLDPQQRLFLHVAWEALEDAGYDPLRTPERIGAYVGASMNTYFINNVLPNRHKLDSRDNIDVFTLDSMGGFQAMVANDKDYISTRVSYKLDLRGPSINVQTACSTGLVVVHLAVQSLLAGECEMALAGTSSVLSPQANGHLWQDGMLVTRDGHCKAFDADASGTIFGSGVGAVLLKPLSRALADGDHVYAVIKGTAVNNDGGVKVGYMAPSGAGETAAARAALASANVPPETITFLEAHGTGTRLGDPIEVASLAAALESPATPRNHCALGSVKTNVGHLQISSGIAGFIKTALALHHREIPPTLHFHEVNPGIDLKASPFHINIETKPWETAGFPRRAGVNSLGIGGTNAHVIMEEAPAPGPNAGELRRPWQILTLSARSEAALERLTSGYHAFLKQNPGLHPADIAFTANTGRRTFDYRRAVVFDSLDTLAMRLPQSAIAKAGNARMVLKLSLQPVSPGFGADLVATSPVFRDTLWECDELLRGRGFPDFAEALTKSAEWPSDPVFATVAAAAVQIGLGRLWLSWGVIPSALSGDPRLTNVLAQTASLDTLLAIHSHPDRRDAIADVADNVVSALPDGACGDLWPALLEELARLHLIGIRIDWNAFDAPYTRRRVSLPTYPFDAHPYWMEPPAKTPAKPARNAAPRHPLIDRSFTSPLVRERFYESDNDLARRPLLADHVIGTEVIVSGAYHLSMVLGAAGITKGMEIADVNFLSALKVPAEGGLTQLMLRPRDDGRDDFTLATTTAQGKADIHATGIVKTSGATPQAKLDLALLKARCTVPVDLAAHERLLQARHILLGPQYQWAEVMMLGDGEALCRLSVPDCLTTAEADAYGFHPGLIDASFGLMIAATAATVDVEDTFIPTGLDRFSVHALPMTRSLWAWGHFETSANKQSAKGTIHLFSDDGTPVLTITGLVGRAVSWDLLGIHQRRAATDVSLFRIAWQEDAHFPAAEAAGSTWLVLGDAPELTAALKSQGEICLAVNPVTAAEHADVIAQALTGRALNVVDTRGSTALALLAAQAMAAHEAAALPLSLQFVTRRAMPVDGHGPLDASAAGIWGLAKVVRLEHPHLACRTIDIGMETSTSALLMELQTGRKAQAEVGLRHGKRFLPRVQPMQPAATTAPSLRDNGSYVVTGASGALGQLLLEWLADAGARTIVAVSRSGHVDPQTAARLAGRNVALHSLSADIAAGIDLPPGLPPVRGMIHAAGTLADATIATATPEQLAKVMQPKLAGAEALAKIANPEKLDFFLMFSSAASVIGNAGQASYAAANSMLDTFAADLRRQGIPATSISWGPWAGEGMAARSGHANASFARLGIGHFTADDGVAHLNAALAAGLAHVCAMRCDWETYLGQTRQSGDDPRAAFFDAVAPVAVRHDAPPPAGSTSLATRLVTASPQERQTLLHAFVLQQLTEALSFAGNTSIEPDIPLMEQGLDSLAAVGLRSAINNALERTFPIGMFFENPTLGSLVHYLVTEIAPENPQETATEPLGDGEDADLDSMDLAELETFVKQVLDA